MKIKGCLCVLFSEITRVKKGTYETKERMITVRPSLFEKVSIAVPAGVEGYALPRTKVLFLVDLQHLVAINKGGVVMDEKTAMEVMTKLDLLSRNKWWRFLGGRAMDMIEMLITMGAGYGFLRLVEVLIVNVFHK